MVALIRREFRKRFSPSSFSAHLSRKFRGSIGLEEGGKEKKSWRDATVASSMMTRRDVIFIVLINQ